MSRRINRIALIALWLACVNTVGAQSVGQAASGGSVSIGGETNRVTAGKLMFDPAKLTHANQITNIIRLQLKAYLGDLDLKGIPLLDLSKDWREMQHWPDEIEFLGHYARLKLLELKGDYGVLTTKEGIVPGAWINARYSGEKGDGKRYFNLTAYSLDRKLPPFEYGLSAGPGYVFYVAFVGSHAARIRFTEFSTKKRWELFFEKDQSYFGRTGWKRGEETLYEIKGKRVDKATWGREIAAHRKRWDSP
jgi:hypothetical protein